MRVIHFGASLLEKLSGRFSGRLRSDRGSTTRAATARLRSVGFSKGYCFFKEYSSLPECKTEIRIFTNLHPKKPQGLSSIFKGSVFILAPTGNNLYFCHPFRW